MPYPSSLRLRKTDQNAWLNGAEVCFACISLSFLTGKRLASFSRSTECSRSAQRPRSGCGAV
jgi:hypothetical protein